ncbi:SDR family NAD(P)-dependent oxidoreductase [Vibrio rotiferianus]|nr:SDR family NAD(P)-dependent oxidoreductase [Vibrio rotiferianus]
MKLVIVTGGSKGLGKSVVEEYLKVDDWCVYEVSRTGQFQHSFNCDLSNVSSVNETCGLLFSEVASKDWDEVVFINNAGDLRPITLSGKVRSLDIQTNVTINQISAFILISTFIATFRQLNTKKTIVNISSGAALKGYAGWSLYCASKAACENFINAIAVEEEVQKHPYIAVNYDPYVMDTSMQATIRSSNESDFPALERFIGYKESQKLLEPNFVARDLVKKISDGVKSQNRYSVM